MFVVRNRTGGADRDLEAELIFGLFLSRLQDHTHCIGEGGRELVRVAWDGKERKANGWEDGI